tara:strand:+ start:9048 stop:9251 length:204 start_codon:yes stop_codon:yes gene_type:complete
MPVNWAKELGIDLQDLKEEHFLHPRQFGGHQKHRVKAEEYWSTRRATDSLQVSPQETKLDHDGQSNL